MIKLKIRPQFPFDSPFDNSGDVIIGAKQWFPGDCVKRGFDRMIRCHVKIN